MSTSDEQTLRIRYEATTPIERIDLVRSGRVARIEGADALSLDINRAIPPLRPGEFHYVRIVEQGGGWNDPVDKPHLLSFTRVEFACRQHDLCGHGGSYNMNELLDAAELIPKPQTGCRDTKLRVIGA